MLKKIFIVSLVTTVSILVAMAEYFGIKNLSGYLAPMTHNTLATVVGLVFIWCWYELKSNKNEDSNNIHYVYLAIGLVMLAIHLIKLVLVRCS